MFQNIQKDIQEQLNEEQINQESISQGDNIKQKKWSIKQILKDLFSLQKICLFIVAFTISMVGFKSESIILSISPFAISFIAAMLSNYKSIGVTYILTLIGTFIAFGANSLLIYFLTSLVFFVFVLLKRPKEIESVNEKRRLGVHPNTLKE